MSFPPSYHQVSDLIIPTMETARQLFFLRTYLAHEVPMLFVGPTGTGKSVINTSFLVKLPKEQYTPNCINFSARTSANQTQDIIMSKLDRRRKGVFGPPMGKKCVVYVGECNFFIVCAHCEMAKCRPAFAPVTLNLGANGYRRWMMDVVGCLMFSFM